MKKVFDLPARRLGTPTVPLAGARWIEPRERPHLLVPRGPELVRWDLRLGEITGRRDLGSLVCGLAASSDGQVVTTTHVDEDDPVGARLRVALHVRERPGPRLALPRASWSLSSVSGDGSRVAIGEPGGRVRVFDVEDGRQITEVQVRPLEGGRVRNLRAVDLSWAGRYLLTRTHKGGGRRVQLETWEVDTDRWLEGAWVPPDFGAPAFLPRGGLGGSPHQIDSGWRLARVDREPGRETGSVLWLTTAPVTAFSRTLDAGVQLEGTRLLVIRRGTGQELREAEHGLRAPPLPLLGHATAQVAPEPEGGKVWVAGDRPLTRLDRDTGDVVRPQVTSWWRAQQLAWTSRESVLRTRDVSGNVRDLAVTPDGNLKAIPVKKSCPLAECLSPSSRVIASLVRPPPFEPLGESGEGATREPAHRPPPRLEVHFLETDREPLELTHPASAALRPLGLDPGDRWLAAEYPWEGALALGLASTEDGSWHTPAPLPGTVRLLAFSPEGAWVAAACANSPHLVVLPLDPPGEGLRVDIGSPDVGALLFLPGERLLVAGDAAGSLRVVDLRALTLARVARLPGDAVTSLALTRDAATLLVTCHDGCLYEVDVSALSEPVLEGRVR